MQEAPSSLLQKHHLPKSSERSETEYHKTVGLNFLKHVNKWRIKEGNMEIPLTASTLYAFRNLSTTEA